MVNKKKSCLDCIYKGARVQSLHKKVKTKSDMLCPKTENMTLKCFKYTS